MANYPQLDNASGVWNLREVYDAVMGGYWPSAKNRLFYMGGLTGSSPYSAISTISTFNPTSGGTAELFGDLSSGDKGNAGASNFVRGLSLGGADWPAQNEFNRISYITLATSGNAADFGDLTNASQAQGAGSNSTRAVRNGGTPGPSYYNTIDYVTIMSTGNATDFGDQTVSTDERPGFSSPTRYVMGGGRSPSKLNSIDFIELATTGNAVDFGDLVAAKSAGGTASNSTRGIFMGGSTPSALTTVQFVTIASQGNAIDFGDLTVAQTSASIGNTGVGNRGFISGANPASFMEQAVQGISIINGGTATDFGDLVTGQRFGAVCSDAHGGLNDGYQGTRPIPFNEAGGDLGLYFGGEPANTQIQSINISSTGNSQAFSNASVTAQDTDGGGNKTRGIIYSGTVPGGAAVDIRYVEFQHKGELADFGDATAAKNIVGCAANNTRLLAGGGATPSNVNNIDYITIGTLGNAADFGDLTVARKPLTGSSSNTRAVFAGGNNPDPTNVIDYVTISTIGNATDFGDLSVARRNGGSAASTTRAVFAGGRSSPSPAVDSNIMDYITTATTGNATDFGDLTGGRVGIKGVSNTIRGCFMGGLDTPTNYANIDFVTIASTGNASDFGDLIAAVRGGASAANGHGGLVGG